MDLTNKNAMNNLHNMNGQSSIPLYGRDPVMLAYSHIGRVVKGVQRALPYTNFAHMGVEHNPSQTKANYWPNSVLISCR